MKPEFSYKEITGKTTGPRPSGSVSAPGSMTQSEINARNNSVIAQQASQGKPTYQAAQQNTQNSPSAIGAGFRAGASQFVEPISGAAHYWTNGNVGSDYSDDSYWLDATRRFHNTFTPSTEDLELRYGNDEMLDWANRALLGSAGFAALAGTALAAPVIANIARREVPQALRVAPNFVRLGPASPLQPLTGQIGNYALHAARSGLGNAANLWSSFAIPGAAVMGGGSAGLGANLMTAGMGMMGLNHALGSYQHGLDEYEITGNPTHSVLAGLENQIMGAPISVAPPAASMIAGMAAAPAQIIKEQENSTALTADSLGQGINPAIREDPETLSQYLSYANPADPNWYSEDSDLNNQYRSPDNRDRERAQSSLNQNYRQTNPEGAALSSISENVMDQGSLLGLRPRTSQDRDQALVTENFKVLDGAPSYSAALNKVTSNLVQRGFDSEKAKSLAAETLSSTVDAHLDTMARKVKDDESIADLYDLKEQLQSAREAGASPEYIYSMYSQGLKSLNLNSSDNAEGDSNLAKATLRQIATTM